MNTLELFAGGGGLALGLKLAGFQTVAVVERDSDSCATLRKNWIEGMGGCEEWPLWEGDVKGMDFQSFAGKVALVSGGPPCQPFSIGGKHQGHRDSRDLFPEAVRVVRTVIPKAFIFENVRGLLRRSFAKYFGYILLQLQYPEVTRKSTDDWTDHLARLEKHHTGGAERGLNYRVVFRKVNAADYGVPQRRERVVIVGFRSDIGEPWTFPAPTHTEDALLAAQWITNSYWDEHHIPRVKRPSPPPEIDGHLKKIATLPLTARWRTVRDAIFDLPEPLSPQAAGIANHHFQPGARRYTGHTGSRLDEPAKTIKAGDHGVPGGENMLADEEEKVRYFTIRESARLQTFPDWYVFPGSWTESMRQIGNAVPVRLAEVVGRSVAETLVRHERRGAKAN